MKYQIGVKDSPKIGSFRNEVNIKKILPTPLYEEIFEEISADLEINNLITINDEAQVHFNNGAFGHAYNDVIKVQKMLVDFSESCPEVFYDQACLPLIDYTYQISAEFFGSENILLVPNCTFGMKCISELLIRKKQHKNIACLLPLYGATFKLLKYYKSQHLIDNLLTIAPSEGSSLVEENPTRIRQSLERAYADLSFSVLYCDEVASQSGRQLPLKIILDFCHEKKIEFVVDGTQSCELLIGEKKAVLKEIDYFVMSSHKWLGNSKTCAIMLYKNEPPLPPVISFGWEDNYNAKGKSIEKIRAQFRWLGMMSSYISYITLSKAIKIFKVYGEKQFQYASALLRRGLNEILNVKSLFPTNQGRVMDIFELKNYQLENLGDINEIQNRLQSYGVFISVKRLGQDCAGTTLDGQVLHEALLDSFNKTDSDEIVSIKYGPITPNKISHKNNDIKPMVSNGYTDHVIKTEVKGQTCSRPIENFYLRVSCWSFNTINNFEALQQIFNNNLPLSSTTTNGLRSQFLFSFNTYERLFSVLETKGFFIRAERLRHHLIFYYAHTAVFYINKLVVSGHLDMLERIDPRLESIMSVGVDEMSWDDLLEENYEWTGMNEIELENYLKYVRDYREKVKELVLKLLDDHQSSVDHIQQGSFGWIVLMGIQHEYIHLETSAVIISHVPLNLIKSKHEFNFPTYWTKRRRMEKLLEPPISSSPADAPANSLVVIPGGTVLMGKSNLEKDIYGWDNEFGSEKKSLKSFQASQMLVSNAEYFEFIQDGGYQNSAWWSKEGWRYVMDLNVTEPKFWRKNSYYRSTLEEIPMPWNFPVEVNNLEAEAFCKWKSIKLGTQVRMISYEESFHMRQLATCQTANHNLNRYASPTPVNLYGGLINGNKVYDISGNVWRHSVSVLTVMDGFRTDPYYNDFTLPTIDGFHNHIVGGSWVSLGNCANLNARYGFRRHFYQYAGIRYVASDNTYHDRVIQMFDEPEVTRSMTEHYTDFKKETLLSKQPVTNWPKLFGEKAAAVVNAQTCNKDKSDRAKVLIANGSVGRITLEILHQSFNLSIDHSDATANKLNVLQSLLMESRIQWFHQIEGKIIQPYEYHLENKSNYILAQKNNSISYYQADYQNLRPQLANYDIIVADMRHKNSAAELYHMATRMNENGLLILGSIDDTRRVLTSGDDNHSLLVLQVLFDRLDAYPIEEIPHIYEDTKNKHQYAISYFSVWKKKNSNENQLARVKENVFLTSLTVVNPQKYYEDENILESYSKFHFGDGLMDVKNFPLRMSEIALEACRKFGCKMTAALDAGCGPGRTAIELCSAFKQVEAYDFSHGFIDVLRAKKNEQNLTNLMCYQGDSHKQDEICSQKKFDLIFGCNLIDRLHTPEIWIKKSKEMLNPGGLLIISSPYTWKPEYTPSEKWIGGFKRDGEDFYTVDGLKQLLAPGLVLLEEIQTPFVIPNADGTYQYSHSNCTIFGDAKIVKAKNN